MLSEERFPMQARFIVIPFHFCEEEVLKPHIGVKMRPWFIFSMSYRFALKERKTRAPQKSQQYFKPEGGYSTCLLMNSYRV